MAIIIGGLSPIVGSSDNDLIIGTVNREDIFGDSSGTLAHASDRAGNDVIFGVDGFDATGKGDEIIGDAKTIGGSETDFARGGDDIIYIGASGTGGNDARGDAQTIQEYGVGGNDLIIGSGQLDEIRGDAQKMLDHAHGGDDGLWGLGGDDSLTGDARDMSLAASGGNDHLYGGDGADALRGDGKTMGDDSLTVGHTVGGNDWLDGGRDSDVLWGDAETMKATAVGGSDHLFGGVGNDTLWGDASTVSALTVGGDDILAGGSGNDRFEFAAYRDVNVFVAQFGNDTVLDFDRGIPGASSEHDQLVFTNTTTASQTFDINHDLVVTVDDGAVGHAHSVTLLGVHHTLVNETPLNSTDFILG